jgi:hypothetical protein
MSMANYLNFTCPKCGSGETISVSVPFSAKLLPTGYIIEDDGHLEIWDCTSSECRACGYVGEAKEFMPLTGATHSH